MSINKKVNFIGSKLVKVKKRTRSLFNLFLNFDELFLKLIDDIRRIIEIELEKEIARINF
jgi:hypothetical protein